MYPRVLSHKKYNYLTQIVCGPRPPRGQALSGGQRQRPAPSFPHPHPLPLPNPHHRALPLPPTLIPSPSCLPLSPCLQLHQVCAPPWSSSRARYHPATPAAGLWSSGLSFHPLPYPFWHYSLPLATAVLTALKDVLLHGVLFSPKRLDVLVHRAKDWLREEVVSVLFDQLLERLAHLYGVDGGQ